ncbi:DNA-binding protein RFX8 isoform X9 [Hemicordylus capensis]|uniref:DNA-binding protein RFX8 isoform X9 n=1 Tax=Hemicordylus capensis TaxID=884348 RepID=UPI00230339F9|nr:DNA-binding protein RFX8 isoform X9 [Hemicordylus capensis]
MAEHMPGNHSNIYQPITQWIVDNFCVCEGCSVPRCLLYEMYVENCKQEAQTQVNPATFGKLVRLVFPDLGTRRLGTRGSARYHYDGIQIRKNSPFYAYYCYLLAEKKETSGEVCSSESAANFQSSGYLKGAKDQDAVVYPLPEFRRFYSLEKELEKKYSYKMVSLFADEYCTYCQEVLQNVKNKEFDQVEEVFTSFWKSLQPEAVMFMSQSDVCQLFQSYDRQLFQEMEKILLHDFLEDVSIQYLKLVRLFSKNIKIWLLATVEDFPPLLGASKIKEVTLFVKRLRRKTYLANMAKPSKNQEEFRKLAANFQLRWNFLLTSISKAMTLCHTDSFGSWHLFNLLLLEYVVHILQTHVEEGGDESLCMVQQANTALQPICFLDDLAAEQSEAGEAVPTHILLTQSQSNVNLSSIILKVLSCLVDADTGNKLIQVILEDKASKSSVKVNVPVGQEALITLKDGQKFIIHTSDPQQDCNTAWEEAKQIYGTA